MVRKVLLALAAATALLAGAPARASQGTICVPTSGVVSGLAFATAINSAFSALLTQNSGGTAPANTCNVGGAPVQGQDWLDTSSGNPVWRKYDGANWLGIGAYDIANHVWVPVVGGGSLGLASATTTDLCSVTANFVIVTGSGTINSFGNSCGIGTLKWVTFSGTPTLTYSANMLLPGGVSKPVAAGDRLLASTTSTGLWYILTYVAADGSGNGKSPTFTSLTTAGSGTYTTPTGAKRLKVRQVGGGGGGGSCGSTATPTAGTAGGTTTFASVTAVGGGGGGSTQNALPTDPGSGGTGGTGTAVIRINGATGALGAGQWSAGGIGPPGNMGGNGGSGVFGGAGGASIAGTAAKMAGATGSGGGGAGWTSSGIGVASGSGGGSGEYVEQVISAPSASYSYTVGAGGAGGTATTGCGTGGVGGSGGIYIEEIYS